MNHLRPIINWSMDNPYEFDTIILGSLFQMTTLLLHENRSHFSAMKAIGEQCAQFRQGVWLLYVLSEPKKQLI
jgi:hypothetical protein